MNSGLKRVVILNLFMDATPIGAEINQLEESLNASLQKIRHCEADPSSAEAISIEESAR